MVKEHHAYLRVPFHPTATSSSSSSSSGPGSEDAVMDTDDQHPYSSSTSSSLLSGGSQGSGASHAPRVGSHFQVQTVPLSHFLGHTREPADPTVVVGGEAGLLDGELSPHVRLDADEGPPALAAAAAADWTSAERAHFSQLFFQIPRQWSRIAAAMTAAATTEAAAAAATAAASAASAAAPTRRARSVDEVFAYFWYSFILSPEYEAYLRTGRVPPQSAHGHTPATPPSTTVSLASSCIVSAGGQQHQKRQQNPLQPQQLVDLAATPGSNCSSTPIAYLGTTPAPPQPQKQTQKQKQLGLAPKHGEEDDDDDDDPTPPLLLDRSPAAGGKAGHEERKEEQENEEQEEAEPPPFEPDANWAVAYNVAFQEHPKDWAKMLAAMREAGITATVPPDTQPLVDYYRSTFKASPGYLAYILGPAYAEHKERASAKELPATYHDEEECYWGRCPDHNSYKSKATMVLCEACPNTAHKQAACSGKVHASVAWLCEDCKHKYRGSKAKADLEAAMQRVDRAVEIVSRRRADTLALVIARKVARVLPRVEAAQRASRKRRAKELHEDEDEDEEQEEPAPVPEPAPEPVRRKRGRPRKKPKTEAEAEAAAAAAAAKGKRQGKEKEKEKGKGKGATAAGAARSSSSSEKPTPPNGKKKRKHK